MNTQASINSVYNAMRAQFQVIAAMKPLAIGTKIEMEGFDQADIQRAMRRHTSTRSYLQNVKYGEKRYNLDGTEAGMIAPEHKEAARLRLNIYSTKRVYSQYKVKNNLAELPKKTAAKQTKRLERLNNKIIQVLGLKKA